MLTGLLLRIMYFSRSHLLWCATKSKHLTQGPVVENPLKDNVGFNDSQKFSDIGAFKIAFTFYNGNKRNLPLFLVAVAKCRFILESFWMQASFSLIQYWALDKEPWLSVTETILCLVVLQSTLKCIYSSDTQRCLMWSKAEGRNSLLHQFVPWGQIST